MTGASTSRLAEWGALAGGLAHEIKNPLSTMNITLQLLREEWAEGTTPRERKTLQRIDVLLAEIRRLEKIVADFLSLAREHALELVPTDIGRLIADLVDFLRPELSRQGIRTALHLDHGVGSVAVDVNLLRQALLNLLRNSIDAMPDGGDLTIQMRREDGSVRIDVIDTGAGMTRETLDRIFQAFFSTKRHGTGLGLPTTRRIFEEHGGSIEAQSEPGRGTLFTARLPVRRGDLAP